MRHRTSRWLASLAVLAAGAAWGVLPAQAQAPPVPPRPGAPANPPAAAQPGKTVRVVRNVPGDSKPVVVEADQIATWSEDGRTVLLLQGRVLILHGVTQTRFQRGVVWADLEAYKAKGVLHVAFYGEGQAHIESSSDPQAGDRVVGDLHTRGEFRLRVPRGKVASQDLSRDPLVDRARAEGVGQRRLPPPAPALPSVPGTLPSVPGVQPAAALLPQVGGGGLRPAVFKPVGGSGVVPAAFATTTTDAAPVPPPATAPRTTLPPVSAGSPAGSASSAKPGDATSPAPPASSSKPGDDASPGGMPAPTPVPGPPAALPAPAPVPGPPPLPPSRQVPVPPAPAAASGPPSLTAPRRVRNLEYRLGPRTGGENWNLESTRLDDGRWLITVSNGVVLSVRGFGDIGSIEVEADRAVVWTRSGAGGGSSPGSARPPGIGASPSGDGQSQSVSDMEFYMAGHVVMRTQRPQTKDSTVIDADELYYDTSRHVAIALQTRMELRPASLGTAQSGPPTSAAGGLLSGLTATEPVIIASDQLFQTSQNTYEFVSSEVFSSKLPSDPGLKFTLARGTLEERKIPRRNILGQPVLDRRTGQPLSVTQDLLRAENVFGKLEGVPFFYTPYLYTNIKEPLGPIESFRFGNNTIYGFETGLTLNAYKLLGILPVEGTKWKLYPDYMSKRGPSLGTLFTYTGMLFPPNPDESAYFPEKTLTGEYLGSATLYGIYDGGYDNLGPRPANLNTFEPTAFRGRASVRHATWDLPYGFDVIAGASFLSDRNYLEQYFKREFDNDPNQATFAYVKQQGDAWSWSALAQARVNEWITTTEWLPRVDGHLQGVSLFDRVISNTRAGVGYAQLRPSSDPINPLQTYPPSGFTDYPFLQTTRPVNTGRAYAFQELMLPVPVGPVTFVPYVQGMAAEYTSDLAGEERGRLWGAAGLRASTMLSRLYPDAKNDLLNVDGLMHKMTFAGNYKHAQANESYRRFPQLDRLDDDATEQMRREFTPFQPVYNTASGRALATSPLFDPQLFAIRRLVENRIETLDTIDVVQLEWRQRLQTQRGYPGSQHIVDWMTLDTSVSLFPNPNRDNFGEAYSFLEYRYLWNIGDRTSFESTGWYDPHENGPRVLTLGMYLDRPDRTSFYLGYRQTDPLQSRLAIASVGYIFSPKYSMSASVNYDFGIAPNMTSTVAFTRTGRDLSVTLGFTYNTYQNNIGLVFEIMPNLLGTTRGAGSSLIGQGGLLGAR